MIRPSFLCLFFEQFLCFLCNEGSENNHLFFRLL